jgi:hypothetical protein
MSSTTCRCCGRALTDPASIQLGIGPVCAMRQKEREMETRQANLFVDVDRRVVIYRDTDGVWDRLVTRSGAFLTFEPIREQDAGRALAKAKELLVNA